MAVSRCAVVDADGNVIALIMADPDVDPPHHPSHKLVPIPGMKAVDHTGHWRWEAEEGFIDLRPPSPKSFRKVEAF